MAKKASLAELMGTAGAHGMQLSRLHEVLGDGMPELPRNAIGRHRLIMALQQRFGENFRNLPGVKGLISQFDGEVSHHQTMHKLRQIRYVPTKKEK